jgi:hypothetical protein
LSTPSIPPTPGSQPGSQPGFEQVIVPPAPQQPTGYPPAPSQVYAQPGYPPPSAPSSGNTVLKIILIVVGVIVLFVVLAVAIIGYGAYRVSKAVHRASSGDVSFSTPNGGSFSTGNSAGIASSDLGVPEYPGARRSNGGMKMKTSAGSLITASFTTPDSTDQVTTFYKDRMGAQANVMQGDDSTILSSGENGDDKIVVTITPEGSGTKIAIMRTSNLHGQ